MSVTTRQAAASPLGLDSNVSCWEKKMTLRLMRRTALALTALVLAACNETMTEPETAEVAAATPEFAVAANTWTTKADMPGTARRDLATATVTNAAGQSVLYAIGGQTSGGSLGRVQAYNVATNSWTYRREMPIAVYNTNGAGVINGKIYVSGGVTRDKLFRRELHVYDPVTNTWTRKQDMPLTTWGGITGVINNQLYVLTCGERDADCYVDFAPLELYRYDPATDQWTFVGYSPEQVERPMGGTIGGKLYLTGANTVRSGGGARFTVYDPATNQWTSKAPLPRARWLGAAAALGAKLYVFGGFQLNSDGSITRVRTTSVYDPATDAWTNRAPMPTLRSGYSASRVVLNRQARIEVVGGSRPGNNLQYVP
jgi:N-acetylneuraminic acid mutarotase